MLKIHNTKFRHVWAGLVKDIMEAKLCWLIVSRCIILSKMSLSHKNGIIKIYERLIGPCGISLDYIGSNSALWSGLTLTGFAETTSWEGTSLHCREILPLRPIWQAPIKLWHGASLTQQLHLWFTNAYTQTHTHGVVAYANYRGRTLMIKPPALDGSSLPFTYAAGAPQLISHVGRWGKGKNWGHKRRRCHPNHRRRSSGSRRTH